MQASDDTVAVWHASTSQVRGLLLSCSANIDSEPPAQAGVEASRAKDAPQNSRDAQHGLTPVARTR